MSKQQHRGFFAALRLPMRIFVEAMPVSLFILAGGILGVGIMAWQLAYAPDVIVNKRNRPVLLLDENDQRHTQFHRILQHRGLAVQRELAAKYSTPVHETNRDE